MTSEYTNLASTFGWGEDVFTELNLTAAQAAFCDEPTRTKLLKKLKG
jgi:adenosine deaminase